MKVIHHLFESTELLEQNLQDIDSAKQCLVQIFTCALEPTDAVEFAKKVKELLPNSKIIGSSVNGIIYHDKQYDQHTLLCIEQYESSNFDTTMISLENKTYQEISNEVSSFWGNNQPKLLRMFVGAYYDYAHQLIETLNIAMIKTQIAGGMSGELYQSKTTPFVFDDTTYQSNALICAGVYGETFSTFHRINTSHTPVTKTYTITGVKDRVITTIENVPAREWLEEKLGFLSTKHYTTWEETAKLDPLVRFQISLESHPSAIRFVHFDEDSQQISQYFSRLEKGTKFKISYTSPSKCIEEVKETTYLVKNSSMETLFCYSCLFRKLYLKNCAQWELTTFHKNPVNGVFLLGEFGYDNGANTLLNGSCVLTGFGEKENYLDVDVDVLKHLDDIQDDSQDLLEFLTNKQGRTSSVENDVILDQIINKESGYNSQTLLESTYGLGNMFQFELDVKDNKFNKICLIKIENSDILHSHLGLNEYFENIQQFIQMMKYSPLFQDHNDFIIPYIFDNSTFVLAGKNILSTHDFIDFVHKMEFICNDHQNKTLTTPFLLRFIVVDKGDSLLEEAYIQLEHNKLSQNRMIISSLQPVQSNASKSELDAIQLIQYALTNDKIIPYYQGLYNNKTKCIDKYEALMRLEDMDGNIHTPYSFMPISKKYRLYLDLNIRMIDQALNDFNGLDYGININLSAHDISSSKLKTFIIKKLASHKNPSQITFEIVEEDYIEDMSSLNDFIKEIRTYGAKIAVDDFGSGYSNLYEIIKIHPDVIKIDGQIIKELDKDKDSEVLLDIISSLGDKLSIDLVAEYVENKEIQEKVEKFHILHSQGYYFAKPLPFDSIFKNN
ncbi:bifunctional diguanylate cyclase/phosphodiesterase [Tannockella kyphosi]|uniref:bifunctional diguanylate cyclase/phosphodiesterase n=1 Tax=Tannockella kyphosi TaxID=2899121 RepID=UPI0020120FFC|nr:EAL domain-containing protein [Tannockella kyphosi]